MDESSSPQPALWRSLGTNFKPEFFRSFLAAHPARQRLRWFRAWSEPDYDFETGTFLQEAGGGVYRSEELGARNFWAVVDTTDKFAKQMSFVGQIPVGKLMCITMRDQLPLADGDEIVLLGRTITNGIPDGFHRPMKRTLVRGATVEVRQGTITTTGTDVVGVGTHFERDILARTTILRALGMTAVVQSVEDDTHMTLATPLEQNVQGVEWERCEDALPEWPAVRINSIRTRSGELPPSAYAISTYGDRVLWLNSQYAPAPGERYSIIYDYLPRYVVREFAGYSIPPSIEGRALPQMVLLDTVVGSAPS